MNTQMKTENRYETIRQKILDEAYAIVLHQGIDQLSMRTIATAVKSSPANLYEYFACKEEIVYELYRKLLSALAQHLNVIDKQLAPDAYLERIGIAYLEFAQAHASLFKLAGNPPPETSFGLRSQPPPNCADTDPLLAFRNHALYAIIHDAIVRQHRGTSNAIQTDFDLDDRTLAFWSLLHGYVSLLGQTSCHDHVVNTWKRLYTQLFLSTS